MGIVFFYSYTFYLAVLFVYFQCRLPRVYVAIWVATSDYIL